MWAKFTAIGFIILILIGNFWLVLHLLGQQPPWYFELIGLTCIAGVLIGGTGLLCQQILEAMRGDQ